MGVKEGKQGRKWRHTDEREGRRENQEGKKRGNNRS